MADTPKQPSMSPTVTDKSKSGDSKQPTMNPKADGSSPFFSAAAAKAYNKGKKK